MRLFAVVLASLLAAACSAAPPAVAPIRSAVPVAASFGKTWTATVDAFADKNVGIRTIDRSSGLIVADVVSAPREGIGTKPHSLADCGRDGYGGYIQPTGAIYNVRVKGDSVSSTVLVTLQWKSLAIWECTTRGVWESGLEKLIKYKAEGRS